MICQSLVNIDLEFVPSLLSEGSSDIVSLLVKNLIPQAVQALNAISVRQFESIATLVSSWQLWRETAHAVQWLHYITQEMNQHAKGVRFCSIFVIWVLSHSQVLVDVAFFVRLTLFAAQPSNDLLAGLSDVLVLCLIGIVVNVIVFRHVGIVDVVVVLLPALTTILVVVGEGRALDKRVILLSPRL